MAGRLVTGDGSRVFTGAALDSRTVERGQLFFALEGERTDGHRFVGDAGERGAAAAVIHREIVREATRPTETGLIRVENTYSALQDLTRHVRRQVPERLVAITGSVGKTTTKEILAALFGRRFRVARNPGNLNNLFGFPLALLNIPDDTEWMVAEMGMSTPGELREISRLGRPDVAVFTNVRPVHLEFFGSLHAIAEAKAELLDGLRQGGLVVANAADPEVLRIARRHRERDPRARVVEYWMENPGRSEPPGSLGEASADYRATAIVALGDGPGHRLRLEAPEGSVSVELPLLGLHNVENFLAAAATAAEIGIPLADLAAAAKGLAPAAGRGEIHRLPGGVVVIDDSYNSNPSALGWALEGAAALRGATGTGRCWAVLGDMLELGEEGPAFHRQAGGEAVRQGFGLVAGVGELASELVREAGEAGGRTAWFATAAEAAEWAAKELRDGDLVLVKGSRGVGLEAVVQGLLKERGAV